MRKRYAGAATAVEVLYTGRDPFTQKLFVDKGSDAGIQAGLGGDRRRRRRRARSRACIPYMAEVTLVTDKDHAVPVQVERSGVRSGAVRRGRRPAAGAALHGAERGHPGRRRAGDVGPRRHVSARARRRARRHARARDRPDVRAHHVHAAGRRRPQRAPARARRAAAARRRGRRSPPRPRPREEAAASAASVAAGRIRRWRMPEHAATLLRRASPDEILRPVQPVVHRCSRCLLGAAANLLPRRALALALRPDFLALVLLYWCIQEPRYVGVGIAWIVGLADGRRRRDGVRPARARLRVARLRRRVLPPPRAALSALAAGAAGGRAAGRFARRSCCSSASSAARRSALDVLRAARSSARCCGRCCRCCCSGRSARARSLGEL